MSFETSTRIERHGAPQPRREPVKSLVPVHGPRVRELLVAGVEKKPPRPDEIARARELLDITFPRHGDQRILAVAFIAALLIHVLAMFVTLPEFKMPTGRRGQQQVIAVRRYIPPPPTIERRQVVRGTTKKTARMIPIPDPTPDDLEPIREAEEPEVMGAPLAPDDVEFLIGDPEGPPSGGGPYGGGPLLPGVGDVTSPRLIESSHVRPEYPEMARKAKLESRVILQAVVDSDGVVGELEVVRCDRPALGFEEASMIAVRQWRYEPATLDGEPVAVFFTVLVDFTLQ